LSFHLRPDRRVPTVGQNASHRALPHLGFRRWTDIHHEGVRPRKGCPTKETLERRKPRPRRSFLPECKAEIVELCRRGDRNIGQVARDFDLTETSSHLGLFGRGSNGYGSCMSTTLTAEPEGTIEPFPAESVACHHCRRLLWRSTRTVGLPWLHVVNGSEVCPSKD
jgi:hypothetical protein